MRPSAARCTRARGQNGRIRNDPIQILNGQIERLEGARQRRPLRARRGFSVGVEGLEFRIRGL